MKDINAESRYNACDRLIASAFTGNLVWVDFEINLLLKKIMYETTDKKRGTMEFRPERLPKLLETMDSILQRYLQEKGSVDTRVFSNLVSYITLARYEAETRAGSYQGTFILPDEVLKKMPDGAVYLEVAMGSGDNLRRIEELKKPRVIIGTDFSAGMVLRAIHKFPDTNSIFFRADAQNLPVIPGSIDVAMLCNAMDRVPDTKRALMELEKTVAPEGYVILAQCMPFQNEKVVPGGKNRVYVPQKKRVESVEEAADFIQLRNLQVIKGVEWNLTTLADGKETMSVDVAIGQVPTQRKRGRFTG